MEQMQMMGGTLSSKLSDTARRLFIKYKAEGIKNYVTNHPDYKGCFLAKDAILNIQAIGDTAAESLENLVDCVDQFIEAVLDTNDEEAIYRLVILPLTDRED